MEHSGQIACISLRNESLTCYRMAVPEAGGNKIADHYFAVDEQINQMKGFQQC